MSGYLCESRLRKVDGCLAVLTSHANHKSPRMVSVRAKGTVKRLLQPLSLAKPPRLWPVCGLGHGSSCYQALTSEPTNQQHKAVAFWLSSNQARTCCHIDRENELEKNMQPKQKRAQHAASLKYLTTQASSNKQIRLSARVGQHFFVCPARCQHVFSTCRANLPTGTSNTRKSSRRIHIASIGIQ